MDDDAFTRAQARAEKCPTCQGVGSSYEDHVGNCPDCGGTGRTNRQVDQLDMQIHLERRSIRDAVLKLQRRAATWEPRPCPPREEYL